MIDRAAWLGVLDVALDALRVRDYERAWALFDELDVMYPPWLFEIHRPRLRLDSQKPETRVRQVLAWAMRESEMNYLEIAKVLGCSRSRAYELARGGVIRIAAAGANGDLEEDFQPADVRRECRRIAAMREMHAGGSPQCPCDGDYCSASCIAMSRRRT